MSKFMVLFCSIKLLTLLSGTKSGRHNNRRLKVRGFRAMARSVSYVSAAKLVSMTRGNNRLAVIDVR